LQVVHDGSDCYSQLWRQHRILKLLEKYNLNANLKGPRKLIDTEKVGNVSEKLIKVAKELGFELEYISDCFKENIHIDFTFFHPIKKEVMTVAFSADNRVSTEAFGDNIESLRVACKAFIKEFPEAPEEEHVEELVTFRFWHYFQGRAVHYDKVQSCLGLDDIQNNYSPSVYKQLDYIKNLEQPDKKGKVIIWHGKPGGGKTFAVRALARDWAFHKGASIEIILDPHEFLSQAAYMRQVALNKPCHRQCSTADDADNPIRLIILEDHAELFTSKCRESKGLSTILNLTDGILGQDLRLMFLLTANEDIKEIDPAIKRPRRCIGVTEFKGFTLEEAIEWAPEEQREFFKETLPTLDGGKEEFVLVDLYHVQDLLEEEVVNAAKSNAKSTKSVLPV
tara:strand:- start:16863 stop:18044 length:1182 start_codon:yes stop_codon:yes gene_type:complete